MVRTPAEADLARRVWSALFDVLVRSAPERTASLARRGLTPNDSRGLFSLDPRQGRTMRSLADEWQCDPSNATWIVDHLETLGLAERRSVTHDRRIKLVVLTPRGLKTRTDLLDEFHRPPAVFAALDRGDLEALDRVLVKLGAASPVDGAQSAEAPPRKRRSRRRAR